MPLDEIALRRETFVPGVLIRLWDGQDWQFPRPRIAWRLTRRPDVPEVEARTTLGPAFDKAVDAFNAIRAEESTMAEVAMAFLRVAASMLVVNYDLDADALHDLLVFDTDDEDNAETWKDIIRVANGTAPKPSPGG